MLITAPAHAGGDAVHTVPEVSATPTSGSPSGRRCAADDLAGEIVDLATELDADMIVIGMRRRSPVGKLFLGSAAQDVLLNASVPVLAVRVS